MPRFLLFINIFYVKIDFGWWFNLKYIKKRRKSRFLSSMVSLVLVIIVVLGLILHQMLQKTEIDAEKLLMPSYVKTDLIPKGLGYSRNGLRLEKVNDIVIHYVGNPNTTAKQNRNYFANIGTRVNSHFIVGLDGEVVQCVPLTERSCASNHRNKDTISIEVCHPDATGKFNEATLNRLKELTVWLCESFNLTEEDVIRHYDITGKNCPLYFVEHENEWDLFKKDIGKMLDNN